MDKHWSPEAAKANTIRETRVSKLLTLEISSARHMRAKIVVRNLSPHGLGARSDIDVMPCEQVIVHLPNDVDIGAIVRWVKKGTFGLSLDERIEPEMLKPKSNQAAHFTTNDFNIGFQIIQHSGSEVRTGFQRSHRQQILSNSSWIND